MHEVVRHTKEIELVQLPPKNNVRGEIRRETALAPFSSLTARLSETVVRATKKRGRVRNKTRNAGSAQNELMPIRLNGNLRIGRTDSLPLPLHKKKTISGARSKHNKSPEQRIKECT
ncbi:hypothetical protein NDU88_004416 [Pleurodeles waltl]|uniref:Uncharacterized protein n=1 Tax=Pleurodeles waltl TaxID=8319 RepID=A0AAV7TRV6_PLEWA|nr:hypothetical protein NDU88_004416 [Pleurodeles waltl]